MDQRADEKGGAHGGKAGDQNGGKEVSTQDWYLHSKGWVVLRALDPKVAELIAVCMELACKTNRIGYDQYDRLTLYNALKNSGFDITKLTKDVETDCSALIRFCLAYAGIMVADFVTDNEVSKIMATGKFEKLTAAKYTQSQDYLKRGDILVTKTRGHTVAVLTNGSKPEALVAPKPVYSLGDRPIEFGDADADVKALQTLLIDWGFSCGSYGVDGDFGSATRQQSRLGNMRMAFLKRARSARATSRRLTPF